MSGISYYKRSENIFTLWQIRHMIFGLLMNILEQHVGRMSFVLTFLISCSFKELMNASMTLRICVWICCFFIDEMPITYMSYLCSYPKTNVLWLQYVVDILLLKKSFVSHWPLEWPLTSIHSLLLIYNHLSQKRTAKDERELRSLKKRFNSYASSKEALQDPFFKDLIVDKSM